MLRQILCKFGLHKWSRNHCGIRICLRCPRVDRYFGASGIFRFHQEGRGTIAKESDSELRINWHKFDEEMIKNEHTV